MKSKIKSLLLLSLASMGLSVGALAATDGTIGTTSTGTADITLDIPKLILIVGFSDFNFSGWVGSGALEANDDLSVSTNWYMADSYGGQYYITATGDCIGNSNPGDFNVGRGDGEIVPYKAYFNDATGITGRVELAAGVSLLNTGPANYPVGNILNNSNLSIEFTEAALLASSFGLYNGTITVVASFV